MDTTTTIFIVIATIVTEKLLEYLAINVRQLYEKWKSQKAYVEADEVQKKTP